MARTPKAPQPPALAELPSRQFYTLKEAAAELNCIYGRTDIDENYILQLGSMGKVAIQWHFVPNKAGYFLIPQSFDDLEYLDCDSRTKFYHLQNASIVGFEGTSFFDIGFYDINKIIFQNNLSTSDIFIENAFNANSDSFLKDPLSKNNFFFSLFYINPEDGINILETGELDLNTGIFHSNYYDEDGGKIIKHGNTNLIYRFREETFYSSFIMEHKLNIDIHKKDLYVLGYDIDLIKAGKLRDRKAFTPQPKSGQQKTMEEIAQLNKTKEFRASKAASAIALLCLHKDIKIDNHSTIASQLLARLPESLTALIGSTSMIDMLREAKDLLDRIEQVQTAEKLVNKNQSNLD